jgi:hypothetical protein
MHFFVHTQKCTNMEQAFLKGYLMAVGGESVLIRTIESIDWPLIEENPGMWAHINQSMVEIAINLAKENHAEAVELAKEFGVLTGYP